MPLHTKVDGDGPDGRLAVDPLFVDDGAAVSFHLNGEEAVKPCDENTIGVVAVLGSTFDGSYEPVQEISDALDDLQERTGLDVPIHVPIHVDGASGGMIAPFIDPELVWDFRLPRNRDVADMFLDDLKRLLPRLEKQSAPAHNESHTGFSH